MSLFGKLRSFVVATYLAFCLSEVDAGMALPVLPTFRLKDPLPGMRDLVEHAVASGADFLQGSWRRVVRPVDKAAVSSRHFSSEDDLLIEYGDDVPEREMCPDSVSETELFSQRTVFIDAPVDDIFRVCCDFDNYRSWTGTGIKSTHKVRDIPLGSVMRFHTGAFGISFFFSLITKSHFCDLISGEEIKSASFKTPRRAPMVRSLRGNYQLRTCASADDIDSLLKGEDGIAPVTRQHQKPLAGGGSGTALTFKVAADVPVPRWVQRKIQNMVTDIATHELKKYCESPRMKEDLADRPIPLCCFRPTEKGVAKERRRFHINLDNPFKNPILARPGKLLMLPPLMAFQALDKVRMHAFRKSVAGMEQFMKALKVDMVLPREGGLLPLPTETMSPAQQMKASSKLALTLMFLSSQTLLRVFHVPASKGGLPMLRPALVDSADEAGSLM